MKSIKLSINIRVISICVLLIALILMFSSVITVKTINSQINIKANIEANKRTCIEQSQLLLSTSEYLTSQVWLFIATGNLKYQNNYWNEVDNVRSREKAMKTLSTMGLTTKEKELINSAKAQSDSLIPGETWTMRLISESVGIDKKAMPSEVSNISLTNEESHLSANEKKELATHYVAGKEYISVKESIKNDLDEFYTSLSSRKNKELTNAISDTQSSLRKVQIYNATILTLLFSSFIVFYIFIMKPFYKYSFSLSHLDESSVSPLKPSGSKEMKSFAYVFNKIYSNWLMQNEHLKALNLIDNLTGIPNRESLYYYIENVLQDSSSSLGLLIIDIDSFKAFNDTYGHLAGDKILIQIALCLSEAVPKDIGIAGRLGGEEFVAAIPGVTMTEVDILANDILSRIRSIDMKHADLPLTDTHITASIGSVVWNREETCTINELIHKADLALYHAKNNGKNQHIMFIPNHATFIHLQNSHTHDVEVEGEMHTALKNGEFVPFFQPKYNITSGKIESLEALVRWNHTVKGILPPSYFVPLFERNSFITKIDLYIFEKVCKILKTWLIENKPIVPIACNFSRLHFKDHSLSGKLKKIIDKYNVPPSYLEIEVTENILIDDNDIIIDELGKLQEMGFSVAIDDFGVGYSSLGILRELPVDVVKLDRSFLQRDLCDRKNIMLISGILYISKVLNLETVCEGVETAEQVDILKKIGFNIAQGYYYSKPVDQVKIEKLLYENNPMTLKKESFSFSLTDAPKLVETLLQQFYSTQKIDDIPLYLTKEITWKDMNYESDLFGIDALLDYHKSNVYGHSFMLTTYPFKSHIEDDKTIIVSGEGTLAEFLEETIESKNFFFNAKCVLINDTLKVDKLAIIEINGALTKNPRRLEKEMSRSNLVGKNQNELDKLYSLLPLGIVRYDASEDMVITYINDYMLDIIGYTRKQFKDELNSNLRMAVYPDDLESIYKKSYELVDNPDTTSFNYRLIRRDGKIITVEYTQCNVIGVTGRPEIQSMYKTEN